MKDIFFGTYESRGLESSRLLERHACKNSVIVLFTEMEDETLRKEHDAKLISQVSECSERTPEFVRGRSVGDIEGVLAAILEAGLAVSPDGNWFVDISGSPKPYFLGLLGALRRRVISPQVTIFHPTANYAKVTDKGRAHSFTSGFDRYIWVPWLWGRPIPTLPWTYIFLLGFEGNRSYEVYRNFEPRYMKAILGKPGYCKEYENIARTANEIFIKEAKPEMFNADASNSTATWQKIEEEVLPNCCESNICFVPLGPKPHALAAGLAAMSSGGAAVLYLVPQSYRCRDVHRGKYLWLHQVSL